MDGYTWKISCHWFKGRQYVPSYILSPFEKGLYYERKGFTPQKQIIYGKTQIDKGSKNRFDTVAPPTSIFISWRLLPYRVHLTFATLNKICLWNMNMSPVKVKVTGQFFFFCTSGKPLSQGTYMSNRKALSEKIQKLWPMLIFFFKVGQSSTYFVRMGSPCHKEPTCQIWRLYLKWLQSYDQCYFFFKVGHRSKFFEWVWIPCHKEPTCQIGRLYLKGFKKLWSMLFFFLLSRSQVKYFCMSMKPLSHGIYMPNRKALSETVKKLWPMLTFSFKVGHRWRSRS